jgi:multiple antibiotic resistance protein
LDLIVPSLKALALVPMTLLPIINPLTAAPVFVATAGHNRAVAKRLARQVAINAWFVIVVSLLVGNVVLDLFGISLPIVRIGGGLLVASTAWRMLASNAGDDVQAAAAESASALSDVEIMRRSFFPITFPLTTGPGTIAASIALGAQIPTSPVMFVAGAGVAVVGAAVTALVLYLVFANSARVLAKLGEIGTLVMMRLLAFMLLCIGIQFIWTGWAELNGLPG